MTQIQETRFYREIRTAREEFGRSGDAHSYLGECVFIALLLAAEEIAAVNEYFVDLPSQVRDEERAIRDFVRGQPHLMNTDHEPETHHHDVLADFSEHFRKTNLSPVINILDALGL